MSDAFPETTLPSIPVRTVIVVGAGLAGLRTVQALRHQGFDGKVTVIGSEPLAPYDRPPLSKKLFANDAPVFFADDLSADLDLYATSVMYSTTVTAISSVPGGGWEVSTAPTTGRDDSSLLSDESATSQHRADAVVLALGTTPYTPPTWTGTRQLYSWEDAALLRAQLESPSRLVIIGAGWIGSEVAAVAAEAGHSVTVLEAAATPLQHQVGRLVGSRLATHFEHENIVLLTGVRVLKVDALNATSTAVTYIDEEGIESSIEADVVLSAIGARPNTSWLARHLELSANGSVHTDPWGRVIVTAANSNSTETLASGLYAVGDCAIRQDEVFGLMPGGHWNTALSDPERVASHIASLNGGLNEELPSSHVSPTPHVFSTQFGKDINLFGSPDVTRDSVAFRQVSADNWSALYTTQGDDGQTLLTGVFTCDVPRDAAQARKLLARGPIAVNAEALTDSTKPLKSIAL